MGSPIDSRQHPLHLDTARLITDTSGNVVWTWDSSDPYGNNPPNENPNGAGQFNFNLRFPGQYADKETNTYYNYFRDYDPGTGRYIQFDPIGLRGGINGYVYVGGNPLSRVDPLGLSWSCRTTGFIIVCTNTSDDGDGLIDPPRKPSWPLPLPSLPHSSDSSSSSNEEEGCMKECEVKDKIRTNWCSVTYLMRGRDPDAYRQCMENANKELFACYASCKEKKKCP